MFWKLWTLLLMTLSVAAYADGQGVADKDISAEEYAVYSALLSPEAARAGASKGASGQEKRLAETSRKKRPHLGALGGDILVVRQQARSPEILDTARVKTVESSSLVGPDVKLDKHLIDEFNFRNREPHELLNGFTLNRAVVLLPKDESAEIFNKGGWDEFYRRYPKARGIITLSRVGFSTDGNRALLYTDSLSGPRTGAGYFVLFQKSRESGKWYIVKHIPLWIS